MAQIWKPQSNSIYKDWITMIVADSQALCKELTDWEQKFIDSMWVRLTLEQSVSQLQADKLEQIYVKYTNL